MIYLVGQLEFELLEKLEERVGPGELAILLQLEGQGEPEGLPGLREQKVHGESSLRLPASEVQF